MTETEKKEEEERDEHRNMKCRRRREEECSSMELTTSMSRGDSISPFGSPEHCCTTLVVRVFYRQDNCVIIVERILLCGNEIEYRIIHWID